MNGSGSSKATPIHFDDLFAQSTQAAQARAPPTPYEAQLATPINFDGLFAQSTQPAQARAPPTPHEAQPATPASNDSSDNDDLEASISNIGGQLWGPELFVCGYTQPSVWDLYGICGT